MNLTELKAQAYDILAQIEFLQRKLQETNQQIGEASKEQEDSNK
jgi:hypothetical protein